MTKDQFLNLLNCWMKADLEHMLRIKSSDGCGGCNFPIALYVMSCMEWLGFLLRDCTINRRQLAETAKNIDCCLDLFSDNYRDQRIRTIFKALFRNGLVHQFGPKFGGISRGNTLNPPVQLIPGSFAPILDADQLANELIGAIQRISESLVTDVLDFKIINKKLEFIFTNDRKEFEKVLAGFSI